MLAGVIMQIDIISVFPDVFPAIFSAGMMRIAQEKGKLTIAAHDLRDWTANNHRQVDDEPYGGGPGMVMKPEPFYLALESLLGHDPQLVLKGERTILLSPQGEPLSQRLAAGFASASRLILLCGRYEGVDERVRSYVSDEISIGDYVLSGGEIAAMALADAVVRLIPGVLGEQESLNEESFAQDNLEYPQYTRPAEFRGDGVPDVLVSGNHALIDDWRRRQAERRTKSRRPDLLSRK